MAPPSSQYLPRWLPHPHICAAQGVGNLHGELEEYRPRSQVLPALPPQGAIAEIPTSITQMRSPWKTGSE